MYPSNFFLERILADYIRLCAFMVVFERWQISIFVGSFDDPLTRFVKKYFQSYVNMLTTSVFN